MKDELIALSAAPATLLLLAGVALAQTPPATPNGARPGNVIGTGQSLPRSDTASHTPGSMPRSTIAPNLPSPPVGPNASPAQLLQAARSALAAGRTGEAQQSLEMAQTRALDRSVPMGTTGQPSQSPLVQAISDALRSLGTHDRTATMQAIDRAASLAGPA